MSFNYRILVFSLILWLISSEIVQIETNIYQSSNNDQYIYYDNKWMSVRNPIDLDQSYISYTISLNYTTNSNFVDILSYKGYRTNKLLRQSNEGFLNRKFTVAYIRIQDSSGKCISTDAVNRYFNNLDNSIRLITGDSSMLDISNSFITPSCYVCDANCRSKQPNDLVNTVFSSVSNQYSQLKNNRYHSYIYHMDYNLNSPSWDGQSIIGNYNELFNVEVKINYWSLVRIYSNLPDDNDNNNLPAILHHFYKNIGFDNAGKIDKSSGYINSFVISNTRQDNSNIMGTGKYWYQIPSIGQFMNNMNNGNIYPKWINKVEYLENKYRIFAYDHPYSRIYLDRLKTNNNLSNTIDDIYINNMGIGCIMDYDSNVHSGIDQKYSEATIGFEYHYFPDGLESYQERGLKVVLSTLKEGSTNKLGTLSNIINTLNDKINSDSYEMSEIPIGYISILDADNAVIKIKIAKFNHIKPRYIPNDQLAKSIPDNLDYNIIPYIDLVIEYYPTLVQPSKTGKYPPDITFNYSPNLLNCVTQNYVTSCDMLDTSESIWFYINNDTTIYRNRSPPRLYNSTSKVIKHGRYGIYTSYNSYITNFIIAYGTNEFFEPRLYKLELKPLVKQLTMDFSLYLSCRVEFLMSSIDRKDSLFPSPKDIILIKGASLGPLIKYKVVDAYGNSLDSLYTVNINDGVILLETLPIQGVANIVITLLNNGTAVNQKTIQRYNYKSDSRVAVIINEDDSTFTLSPATLNGKYSCPSLIGPLSIIANRWYTFIFTNFDFDDYIYFDFKGTLPPKLSLIIETENGYPLFDLSLLEGLTDVTFSLQVFDIAKKSGGWGEIYKFQFNLPIVLLAVRPVLSKSICGIPQFIDTTLTYTMTAYNIDLKVTNSLDQPKQYSFDSFTAEIFGQQVTFSSPDQKQELPFHRNKGPINNTYRYSFMAIVLICLMLVLF